MTDPQPRHHAEQVRRNPRSSEGCSLSQCHLASSRPEVKASYVVEWPRCPRDMTPTVRPWNISVTCWELSHKYTERSSDCGHSKRQHRSTHSPAPQQSFPWPPSVGADPTAAQRSFHSPTALPILWQSRDCTPVLAGMSLPPSAPAQAAVQGKLLNAQRASQGVLLPSKGKQRSCASSGTPRSCPGAYVWCFPAGGGRGEPQQRLRGPSMCCELLSLICCTHT